MVIRQSLEYQDNGTVEMLTHQDYAPYYASCGIDDLLRAYPQSVTRKMAQSLYMLGYIEGKRAERDRRKRGTVA